MTTMTIVVKVKPEKLQEFLQAVDSLIKDQDNQQGVKRSALYRHIDDKNAFSLIYEWEVHEERERYLSEEKFRVLLGALKVLCDESSIRYGCDPSNPNPFQCPVTSQKYRGTS